MNGSESIYRHYSDAEGFVEYLRGRWEGYGLQGLAETESGVEVQVRLRATGDSMELIMRKARRREQSGIFVRLASLLPRQTWRSRYEIESGEMAAIKLNPRSNAARHAADMTEATAATEGVEWRLTFQAMTDDKLHLTVNRAPGGLYYAGSVERM